MKKLVFEGMQAFLKIAKIEPTDPRLFKEGSDELLDEDELTPVLTDIISTGLGNFAKNKQDEATRKVLQSAQKAVKDKYGVTQNLQLDDLIDFVVNDSVEKAVEKAQGANKADFSKINLQDVHKIMPHLVGEIEKNKQEAIKGYVIEADKARNELAAYIEKDAKQKHNANVMSIARQKFLKENPNGLVEDAAKRERQLTQFLNAEIDPKFIKVIEGELICIDENGETIADPKNTYAPKNIFDDVRENWAHGFNKVSKPNGAPQPNGTSSFTGIGVKTKSKMDAIFNGQDKDMTITSYITTLKGTPEYDAAKKYLAKLSQG